MRVTPRQADILRLIHGFRVAHGYSPSLEEIAEELGVSRVTVHEHVHKLRAKRLLTGRRRVSRSLDLTEAARAWLMGRGADEAGRTLVPLVGVIAAGQPLEALEEQDTLDLSNVLRCDSQTFALRVRGDSMIEDQIRDGDYVIVQRRDQIRDGQIVVAVLPSGEATLKRLYREPGRIRLQPANARMKPIYVEEEGLDIQGVVIGVLRKYG